jgi:hypothetical protein
MNAINWRRWWPVTGILFVAFYIVGLALISSPDSGDTDAQILAHYAKRSNRVDDFIAFFLILGAVLLLIWFLALLRNRLAQSEGTAGTLTSLATGAGLAAAALWVVSDTLFAAPSAVTSETSKFHLDPNTYRLLNDIGYGIWFSGTTIMAILVVATAILARRTGLLPKWLVWLSYPVALTMLVAFFFIPFLIMLGWILVVSVTLIVRPSVEVPAVVVT